jgi:endonuclease G, mitochondrial
MNRFRLIFYPLAMMFSLACLSVSLFACDECDGKCKSCQCGPVLTVHATQLPSGAKCTNYLLVGHLYAISLDPETKLAAWCCYRATRTSGETRNSIERSWLNVLPDQSLESSDYVGSDYDIGHLAPLATLKNSPYAFELNAMINCAPQTPALNRGPWLKLETMVRELAETHASVEVVVGPLYERKMKVLPNADESHRVPSHYFAVIFPERAEAKAFIIDQACDRGDPLSKFATSIDNVSDRSGLAFPRKR